MTNKQPEPEPVAWQWLNTGTFRKILPATAERSAWTPLYTAPPQRKPLNDDEAHKIWVETSSIIPMSDKYLHYKRAIEAAHGVEKVK